MDSGQSFIYPLKFWELLWTRRFYRLFVMAACESEQRQTSDVNKTQMWNTKAKLQRSQYVFVFFYVLMCFLIRVVEEVDNL